MTIREQRAQALVEHWLGNARKMRAVGELEAAHLELLKAKELGPTNEAVAAEMAELRRIYTPPAKINYDGAQRRFPQIAEQRAKAMVDYQLQTANKLISKRDYKGAAEELRRAELAIEAKQDIDWGDLPQQVKQAQEKVKILVDALAG